MNIWEGAPRFSVWYNENEMPDLPSFSLPVSIFLYVFGAYMIFYVLYSLFNIYHLVRYGVYSFSLYVLVTVFTGGTILLVAGSIFLLMDYDWTAPISFNGVIQDYDDSGLFPNL